MALEKKSTFAKNLIAIRKAKGVSQRDLAKLSGISNRMIAYYETHSVIPPIDKLEKLALVLDVSLASLLDKTASNKDILNLNTRTLKKIKLLEQLSPENQRKVLDYIQVLLDQERLQKQKGK